MLYIPIEKLNAGMKLDADATVFDGSKAFLLKKGTVLTQKTIEGLYRFGLEGVYIHDKFTEDIKPSVPILDSKRKQKTLKNLEWIFEHVKKQSKSRAVQHLKHIDQTVQELIAVIQKEKGRLINIADLKAYDDYTYHHSLSVAILSIAIGSSLGLSHDELRKLGFAAIMHDIGKMEIPIEIINKPGRLSHEEFEIIKRHANYSKEYLIQNNVNDSDIYESVVCHHEKLNGEGYPYGLMENEIPYYSKIIAVADVYDALTSLRSYRVPMVPLEVTERIMAGTGESFDIGVVQAFINKVEFYPAGSFVELSNGQQAVIVGHANQLRPIVRLLVKPYTTIDLFHDKLSYGLTIKRVYDKIPVDIKTLNF